MNHDKEEKNQDQVETISMQKASNLLLFSELRPHLETVRVVISASCRSDYSLPAETISEYVNSSGGKSLRPALCLASSKLCGCQDTEKGTDIMKFAAAIEMVHNATLLHDDVIDASDTRRKKDTVRKIWGNSTAILAGDFMFSKCFSLLVSTKNIKALKIFSDACSLISSGELLQLSLARTMKMTLDDYLKIINAKTAILFSAACQCGAVAANADPDKEDAISKFGRDLGMAFQITDDILDYSGLSEIMGKKVGSDFFDGKMTLPVMLAYEQASKDEKDFWERCFVSREYKDGDLNKALKILDKYKTMEKAEEIASKYAENAKEYLNYFSENGDPVFFSALSEILSYCLSRKF